VNLCKNGLALSVNMHWSLVCSWNNLASAVDMIASAVQANQAGPVLGSAAPAPGFAGAHSQGYAGAPAPGLGSLPFSVRLLSLSLQCSNSILATFVHSNEHGTWS
jgi:hypothetical protein